MAAPRSGQSRGVTAVTRDALFLSYDPSTHIGEEIMATPVRSVETALAHSFDTGSGRSLYVAARGTVSTTGWKNPQLTPRVHVTPPADGIWDFDFVADAPGGIVLDVISDVSADWFGPDQAWVRGVRIHAATNYLVVLDITPAPTRDLNT